MAKASPGGQLLGIDADPRAIELARENLKTFKDSALLVNDNFSNLEAICKQHKFYPVHGILLDLGLSSLQLDEQGGGFSFLRDEPLDMRFNPQQKVTAAELVNDSTEAELTNILRKYGEEPASRHIASYIINSRPVTTTAQLAGIVERATGGRRGKIHPATRTFQALRIAVNDELQALESALKQSVDLLGFEGRLVVISYHSLEDRIVKHFMQQEARGCICPPGTPACICGHEPRLRILIKKVVTPSAAEIADNPRSRSAKLRVAQSLVSRGDCYASPGEQSYNKLFESIDYNVHGTDKLEMAFLAG
jgi:16S rRNA (cytosine1402-N4)-methyltransferase